MKKIRVLIADDIESIREYFEIKLNSSQECECIGTAFGEKDVIE